MLRQRRITVASAACRRRLGSTSFAEVEITSRVSKSSGHAKGNRNREMIGQRFVVEIELMKNRFRFRICCPGGLSPNTWTGPKGVDPLAIIQERGAGRALGAPLRPAPASPRFAPPRSAGPRPSPPRRAPPCLAPPPVGYPGFGFQKFVEFKTRIPNGRGGVWAGQSRAGRVGAAIQGGADTARPSRAGRSGAVRSRAGRERRGALHPSHDLQSSTSRLQKTTVSNFSRNHKFIKNTI